MINLSKILVLLMVLFGSENLFAQIPDALVINSEFKKMDSNQDGFVNYGEMQEYQVKTFEVLDKDKSSDLDSAELEADQADMHKQADLNQDGKISQDESSRKFTDYFKEMDKDQNGKVSEAEYTDYWKLIYKF